MSCCCYWHHWQCISHDHPARPARLWDSTAPWSSLPSCASGTGINTMLSSCQVVQGRWRPSGNGRGWQHFRLHRRKRAPASAADVDADADAGDVAVVQGPPTSFATVGHQRGSLDWCRNRTSGSRRYSSSSPWRRHFLHPYHCHCCYSSTPWLGIVTVPWNHLPGSPQSLCWTLREVRSPLPCSRGQRYWYFLFLSFVSLSSSETMVAAATAAEPPPSLPTPKHCNGCTLVVTHP